MKKILIPLMALAFTATAFTSCSDVPAPYSINFENNNNTGGATTSEAKGTGTQADPFNVAAALAYITAGQNLDKEVYVAGTVTDYKGFDAKYGSAGYSLTDDGTGNKLVVFGGKYLGNVKFTSNDQLKNGDKVTVCGKLVNFNGTKEFAAKNYIYELNGKKAGGTAPAPAPDLNTEETAWTPEQAVEKIKAEADGVLDGEAYVKGKIASVENYNAKFKSMDYYVSTNGTDKTLYIYSGKGLNGADFGAKGDLKVGQEVIIKGLLTKYHNKKKGDIYQFNMKSKIVKVIGEGTTTHTDPDPSTPGAQPGAGGSTETPAAGTTVTYSMKRADVTSNQKSPTFKVNGVTFTATNKGGHTPPLYHAKYPAVRLYAKNQLEIEAEKEIVKIEIVVDNGDPKGNRPFNGNDEAYAESGTKKVKINKDSDDKISFSGLNSKVVTIVNDYTKDRGGRQIRIKEVVVTYAK